MPTCVEALQVAGLREGVADRDLIELPEELLLLHPELPVLELGQEPGLVCGLQLAPPFTPARNLSAGPCTESLSESWQHLTATRAEETRNWCICCPPPPAPSGTCTTGPVPTVLLMLKSWGSVGLQRPRTVEFSGLTGIQQHPKSTLTPKHSGAHSIL